MSLIPANTPTAAQPPKLSGAPTPTTNKAWSEYQTNIFDFVANAANGNAIIEAVAGSGKSTTIVECTKRIPQGKSCILLAFNKTIAEELKSRGVNARTFHSLTYTPVMNSRGAKTVETNKLRMLAKQILTSGEFFMYGAIAVKLVSFARNEGIGTHLVADTEDAWYSLIDHHDLQLDNDHATIERAIELSQQLLQASNESKLVDFDDMLYLAVKDNIALPKFDYIFVDEAQDTNAIQRAIVLKIAHETSRVIFVGDPAQSIYGFRGASSNSMELLSTHFNCTHLPLSISYRCATSIVKAAQQYVTHIQAAPNAPQGQVVNVPNLSTVVKQTAALVAGTLILTATTFDPANPEGNAFTPRDLVVCRTTKPLISLAFQLMRQRVPVKIMGREIGQGLKTLIGKMNATNLEDLTAKLDTWCARECEKALAKHEEGKAEQIQDKCDAIVCLIDGLPETNRTIPSLLDTLDSLFNDDLAALTLSTIRKAKGMEADRVWWLNSSQCPANWAKQEWQEQQELNLCYVAITRAKTTLLYVQDGSGKRAK